MKIHCTLSGCPHHLGFLFRYILGEFGVFSANIYKWHGCKRLPVALDINTFSIKNLCLKNLC